MSGTGSETLTAALRRLADEHASGLLTVATPGRDVVLELADGVPVGIGPTHDVSGRVGREAGPGLVAAAVVDDLVDRTVAAIVDGDGDWTWDVSSDADMMPVPQGLAAELSRRAVDAAQALATLGPEMVLQPGRDLGTTGEVDRIRALFDGERTIGDVAAEADVTVPTCATIAAALVRAGALSTGMEDAGPPSWTDTVAGAEDDEDDDEPELWVMDEPDDVDDDAASEDGAAAATTTRTWSAPPSAVGAGPDGQSAGFTGDAGDAAPVAGQSEPEGSDIPQAMEWVAGDDDAADVDAPAAAAASPQGGDDDDWDNTTWLDELEGTSTVRPRDGDAHAPGSDDHEPDARTALSSMINDLQGNSRDVQTRDQPPAAPTGDEDQGDETATSSKRPTDAGRKEPKAEPGEVAEFLRELSRLALDDD